MNEDDRSRSGSLHWPIHPLSTLAGSTRQDRFILLRDPVPIEQRLCPGTTGFAQTAAQRFILHALLWSEPLEGKEQRRTSRDAQGTSDGSTVTRRGRDLHAVVDNLTPRATAPVQRVPAVLRPIGDVADKRHQRPLPPPPQWWYPRTRHIAPIQGEYSRNRQPTFRHRAGQSRRHQIMNIHHIRMKTVDRAPNRRDSRQGKWRQRTAAPPMASNPHERHSVLVALHRKRNKRLILIAGMIEIGRAHV